MLFECWPRCGSPRVTATPAFAEPADAGGAWKSRTEVVWSSDTRSLMPQGIPGLDAIPSWGWIFSGSLVRRFARTTAVRWPTTGTLSWRTRGAADYDRQFIHSVFKGALKDGRPEGQGALLVFRTGYSYTGNWHDGLMHGHGVLKLENGDRYDGDFVAGKMEGSGRYVSSDRSIYQGEFRNGQRHGRAKLLLADGAFWTVWDQGAETSRQRFRCHPDPAFAEAATGGGFEHGEAPAGAGLQEKNEIFTAADPGPESHVYDAEFSPGAMIIQPGSKELREAWKGGGKISSGYEDGLPAIYGDNQFASVFHESAGPEQEESSRRSSPTRSLMSHRAHWIPSLVYTPAGPGGAGSCGVDTAYAPDIVLRIWGGGR